MLLFTSTKKEAVILSAFTSMIIYRNPQKKDALRDEFKLNECVATTPTRKEKQMMLLSTVRNHIEN